jgi:ribonuclease HI
MIHVYTDGACRGNGKADAVGSFAFVIIQAGRIVKEDSKAERNVTNNIMELKGCIMALEYCRQHYTSETIKVHCDSQYVVKGVNEWSRGWIKNNWQRWNDGLFEPVKNAELWKLLLSLIKRFMGGVQFEWVRGHNNNLFNERCDLLCNQALDTLQHKTTV